jgi:mannosyl-oligosaccharide glucosidase
MAVTSFIERVKAASAAKGPSEAELGMDLGMGAAGAQVPFGAPQKKLTAVESTLVDNPDLARAYLQEIYQPLKRHYDWFRRTQRGQIKQYSRKARSRTEGYRWRGRSELHVLTSGMDDYPRGPPHAGELHLDLISWVAFFSRTMREIATFVGEKDDEAMFIKVEQAVLDNIDGTISHLSEFHFSLTALVHPQICTGMKRNRCTVTSMSTMRVGAKFYLPVDNSLKFE